MLFQQLLEQLVVLADNFHALAAVQSALLRLLVDSVSEFN